MAFVRGDHEEGGDNSLSASNGVESILKMIGDHPIDPPRSPWPRKLESQLPLSVPLWHAAPHRESDLVGPECALWGKRPFESGYGIDAPNHDSVRNRLLDVAVPDELVPRKFYRLTPNDSLGYTHRESTDAGRLSLSLRSADASRIRNRESFPRRILHSRRAFVTLMVG